MQIFTTERFIYKNFLTQIFMMIMMDHDRS